MLKCEDKLVRSACGSICADFRLAVAIETWLMDADHPLLSLTPSLPPTSNTLQQSTIGPSSGPPSNPVEADDSNERCLHEPQENPIDNSLTLFDGFIRN